MTLAKDQWNQLEAGLSQKLGSVLYRYSRDGAAAKSFHKKCDSIGKNVVVFNLQDGSIVGGFTSKNCSR